MLVTFLLRRVDQKIEKVDKYLLNNFCVKYVLLRKRPSFIILHAKYPYEQSYLRLPVCEEMVDLDQLVSNNGGFVYIAEVSQFARFYSSNLKITL